LILGLISADNKFANQGQACDYFIRLTGLIKNLDYACSESAEFNELMAKIDQLYNPVS
jgi:V/A-type H+-transporting ATPase subunit A